MDEAVVLIWTQQHSTENGIKKRYRETGDEHHRKMLENSLYLHLLDTKMWYYYKITDNYEISVVSLQAPE